VRAFACFLAAIAGTLLLAALLAYPAYLLVHPLRPDWWFDKIATRLWQLLMLAAVVLVIRRLRLTNKADFGYGAPRPRWQRQFWIGLAAGLATMLPVTLTLLALDVRPLRAGLDAALLADALLAGLGSGLAVGFLEETFFRGLMQGAVLRGLRRPLPAIALVAVVYAALHFLARVRIPHEQVDWLSGLTLLGAVLGNFAAPGAVVDSFLALVAVGLLLGLVTWWTGSIALAVGLHAGWVWMMRTTVGLTSGNAAAPFAWLVSRSDGYTGWLVLGWTLLVTALAVAARGRLRSWRQASRGDPSSDSSRISGAR
jgi:membrane protease YdiL (CAAX protease family)